MRAVRAAPALRRRSCSNEYATRTIWITLSSPRPIILVRWRLTAAAMTSLRRRTYVLNVGFWNPALLAREVATLDLLSAGRVEIGLGAKQMKVST